MVVEDHKIGLNAIILRLVNGPLLFNSAFKVTCSQEGETTFSSLSTPLRNICSLLKIPANDLGLFINLGGLFLIKQGCCYLATLMGSKERFKEILHSHYSTVSEKL